MDTAILSASALRAARRIKERLFAPLFLVDSRYPPLVCAVLMTAGHNALRGSGPTKVAAIALANKLVRMAWAMMARNERYKEPAALTA
jgi:hypothetical protein